MSDADDAAERTAIISTIGCLVNALSQTGALDLNLMLDEIRATSVAHKSSGNPKTGAIMGIISDYLEQHSKEPPIKPKSSTL